MTKLCSFNCSNENEYIFDFVVDVDRKTVFCVGRLVFLIFLKKNFFSEFLIKLLDTRTNS